MTAASSTLHRSVATRWTPRALAGALTIGLALAAAGCGSDGGGDAPAALTPPPDDLDAALTCITDAGFEAAKVGDKSIQVGAPGAGPRIDYFQSSGEAEGLQFDGEAEGAEQLGAALLFVNRAPDEDLEIVENCVIESQD